MVSVVFVSRSRVLSGQKVGLVGLRVNVVIVGGDISVYEKNGQILEFGSHEPIWRGTVSRKRLTVIKRYGVWALTLKRDPCVYCGRVPKLRQLEKPAGLWFGSGTIEHITPRSQMSKEEMSLSSWENLAGACRKCNSSRGNRSLLNWLLVVYHTKKEPRKGLQ